MAKKIKAGGDVVGRDKNTSASGEGFAISGNVTGSKIINSKVSNASNVSNFFLPIYRAVEDSQLTPVEKNDLKAEIADVETEIEKGDAADESFLTRRLHSIERMAPDILDVILTTFANPVAGLGMIAKKVAEKMRAEAK
jgi:hypothetical protein